MIKRTFTFKKIATFSTGHPNYGVFLNGNLIEDGWLSESQAQDRVEQLQSLADNAGQTWSFDNVKLTLSPGIKTLSNLS
jgi:hypothetical protein